jgi:hypothetical protein
MADSRCRWVIMLEGRRKNLDWEAISGLQTIFYRKFSVLSGNASYNNTTRTSRTKTSPGIRPYLCCPPPSKFQNPAFRYFFHHQKCCRSKICLSSQMRMLRLPAYLFFSYPMVCHHHQTKILGLRSLRMSLRRKI